MEFRWNDWNLGHIAEHGVRREEAEYIIRNARPPYPEERGDDKWRVWGKTSPGRFLQVVFVVGPDDKVFVIHCRPLNEREKRRFRRRKRR